MPSSVIDSSRCLMTTINLLLILGPTTNTSGSSHRKRHVTNCPQPCYCNEATRAVQCARRGVASLPETIPDGTRLMNLNGNKFRSGKIRRFAFSRYPGIVDGNLMDPVSPDGYQVNSSLQSSPDTGSQLEQLLMSDCSIDLIEPRSFSDLVNLRWLDLSDNLISTISPSTFSGSHLEHLFLNGNRRLVLEPDSFVGLSTSGLYLHDCGLNLIEADTFSPLIGLLRTLWIQGNRIQRLGPELEPIVTSLVDLRTSSNPLRCDCELVWLKRLLEAPVDDEAPVEAPVDEDGKRISAARSTRIASTARDLLPTCASPPPLTGRSFADLSASEFQCRLPVFGDVEAQFDGRSGVLSCAARGNPTPEVRWVRRTAPYIRSPPIVEMSQRSSLNGDYVVSQLVLSTHDNGRAFRQQMSVAIFSCVARNAAGHVTLMVTIELAIPPEADFSSYTTSFARPVSTSGSEEVIPLTNNRNSHVLACDDHYVMPHFANCSDDVDVSRQAEVATTEAALSNVRGVFRGYVIKELACAVAATCLATVALVAAIVTSLSSNIIGNCRKQSESGHVVRSGSRGQCDRHPNLNPNPNHVTNKLLESSRSG